jgi:hypothetical protein
MLMEISDYLLASMNRFNDFINIVCVGIASKNGYSHN